MGNAKGNFFEDFPKTLFLSSEPFTAQKQNILKYQIWNLNYKETVKYFQKLTHTPCKKAPSSPKVPALIMVSAEVLPSCSSHAVFPTKQLLVLILWACLIARVGFC